MTKREWYYANREEILLKARLRYKYDKEYRDGKKSYSNEYYQNHTEARKEYRRKHMKTVNAIINMSYYNKMEAAEIGGGELDFTKEDFTEFVLNSDDFLKLFDLWVNSGFEDGEKPCIVMKDRTKIYSIDNIRIIKKKQFGDVNVLLACNMRKVIATDESGSIKEYVSISEAVRSTSVSKFSIVESCKNGNKVQGIIFSYGSEAVKIKSYKGKK